MQDIEGMEEFLLRAVLAADEMDVIDEQNVCAAVFLVELGGILFPIASISSFVKVSPVT